MKRAKSGTILIASFWILAILSILAIGIGFRVSLELRLSKYAMDRAKALYLARAGVVRAEQLLSKDPITGPDSIRECGVTLSGAEPESIFTNIKLADGTFTVGYKMEGRVDPYPGMSDEERKININKITTANRYILENLLGPGNEALVSAIIDWRDEEEPALQLPDGAENQYYQSLEPSYSCKNGEFSTIEELLLVKGMTPEIFNSIKDYVTVYGDGKVNINTAPEKILIVLRIPADIAGRIVTEKNGADGITGTPDDWVLSSQTWPGIKGEIINKLVIADPSILNNVSNEAFTNLSSYLRIESKGIVDKSKIEKTIVCVVKRGDSKLISYREY